MSENTMTLEGEVCTLFNQVMHQQIQEIDLKRPLADYDIDSVRAVKLLCNLEVHFGIDISDAQAQGLRCLQDVVDVVRQLRKGA